jgi:glycosyltransferase involved in cell wall biosynthesis
LTLTYALITPARDEAENLRRLGAALLAQTVLPSEWIVVDNGSTDDTPTVAAELAAGRPWIRFLRVPGEAAARPGAPVVRAFHAGLATLSSQPDVVVKLDADVSFEPDYFERLLDAFASDPRLGIAGGRCDELANGEWRPQHVTGGHVRGAARAYRADCLADVLPLEEGMGWDGIDGLTAAARGWKIEVVPGLAFRHHRSVGERDGARRARWLAQGRGMWAMGYRPGYVLVRTLFRARRDPAALAMVWAYAAAALRREPRLADPGARAELRRRQSVRSLPLRAREALGRRD